MNRGRDPPRSLCEKKFILEAIKENKRLDGRDVYDYRELTITFGKEPGQVEVRLGKTRVLGHVTCQVIQPRPERPTDGKLFFNVELSPMASPAFEVGRPSSYAVEITRILERCLKESRAVDTESLCIIAGEKVWEIRVDLHVVDHCGNILDCASIAAVTALKHFRRPDVTVIGEEATIHPVTERDPVPLTVHHMPLCFTFAFFCDGEYLVVDPSLSEEAVMDSKMVVGMNIHREICALQMNGGVVILPDQVVRCTQIAAAKVIEVTAAIKKALKEPKDQKIDVESVLRTKKPKETVSLPEVMVEKETVGGQKEESLTQEEEPMVQEVEPSKPEVVYLGEDTAQLGMGGPSSWEVIDEFMENEEEKEKVLHLIAPAKTSVKGKGEEKSKKGLTKSKKPSSKSRSDSEEEDVVLLTKDELSEAGVRAEGSVSTGRTSLSELVALESRDKTESDDVMEITRESPAASPKSVATSSVKTRQGKGKGRRSGQQKLAGSIAGKPEDSATTSGRDRGESGRGARTSRGRGRGKRRKSSTKTN